MLIMSIDALIKIPPVQTFLMDGSVMSVFEAVLEKFALDKGRAEELLDLTDAVLDEKLELKDMPAMLMSAFGIEEERAKRLACDIAGFRLLPLEDYVPNIVQQITEWGGDLSKYPKSKVGKTRMSAETFAAKLDEQLGLDFSEVLVKRSAFLMSSYWHGKKTKDSTLTFFSRAISIGGLGLTPEQSHSLLSAIDAERNLIDVVELIDGAPAPVSNTGDEALQEIEKMTAIEFPSVSLEPTIDPVDDTNGRDVSLKRLSNDDVRTIEISPSHELTSEIPIVNKPKPMAPMPVPDQEAKQMAKQMTREATETMSRLEKITMEVMESVKPVLARKIIAQENFAEVVRKVLKGIRTLTQTHGILERDFHCDGADLDALNFAIEVGYERYHGVGEVEVVKEVVISEAVPDTARVSLSRTLTEERALQSAAIPQAKIDAEQIAARPIPVAPMLTVGSVAPNKADRVLTDIQPVRRLVGPVEELGNMTPAEFRRLSTTPADAVQKIEDILHTLEKQNYEDRVKGIQAWRQSPMNQLYISMTTTALMGGISLAEVATKRRSAGDDSLSPAEIRAVSALNERLRF